MIYQCPFTIIKYRGDIKIITYVNKDESHLAFGSEVNVPESMKNKLASLGYPLEDELNSL